MDNLNKYDIKILEYISENKDVKKDFILSKFSKNKNATLSRLEFFKKEKLIREEQELDTSSVPILYNLEIFNITPLGLKTLEDSKLSLSYFLSANRKSTLAIIISAIALLKSFDSTIYKGIQLIMKLLK